MARLDGMRTLVTGGTSGIGAAIAVRLAGEGARIALTGRDAARGEQVAARVAGSFVRADARDPDEIDASLAHAVRTLGGLDCLVLNAGVLHDAPLSETSDEAWDAVIGTNLIAPFRYARGALPLLRAAGGGSIVAIASDAGVWGEVDIGAYSVSKRALIMLVQMLAVEGGPHRVRANAVCPGDIEPGMASRVGGRVELDGDTGDWILPPLGRIGRADDVAAAAAFLASPDAAFCTGATLLVDGGMRASIRGWSVSQ